MKTTISKKNSTRNAQQILFPVWPKKLHHDGIAVSSNKTRALLFLSAKLFIMQVHDTVHKVMFSFVAYIENIHISISIPFIV